MRITQNYWNQYNVQPVSRTNRPRTITREEPVITWVLDRTTDEEILMKDIELAMTGVGLLAGAIIIGCIFALVAHYVSPWAVVSILALAGLIGTLVTAKKRR